MRCKTWDFMSGTSVADFEGRVTPIDAAQSRSMLAA
jgi:hypothetical protein